MSVKVKRSISRIKIKESTKDVVLNGPSREVKPKFPSTGFIIPISPKSHSSKSKGHNESLNQRSI